MTDRPSGPSLDRTAWDRAVTDADALRTQRLDHLRSGGEPSPLDRALGFDVEAGLVPLNDPVRTGPWRDRTDPPEPGPRLIRAIRPA